MSIKLASSGPRMTTTLLAVSSGLEYEPAPLIVNHDRSVSPYLQASQAIQAFAATEQGRQYIAIYGPIHWGDAEALLADDDWAAFGLEIQHVNQIVIDGDEEFFGPDEDEDADDV